MSTEWSDLVGTAWHCAEKGDFDQALACYKHADMLGAGAFPGQPLLLNPELSLLRHKAGIAEGCVRQLPPNEDAIITINLSNVSPNGESSDAKGMVQCSFANLDANIQRLMHEFSPPCYHYENIHSQLPHIQVLSSGRCGTISLYRLIETTHYLAYHTFFFQTQYDLRYEQAYRCMAGNFDSHTPANEWLKVRAAEWIGCCNLQRPMMMINHLDTPFAPIFALMHPQSKFIYLRRNPTDAFESFYSKAQWSHLQINPLHYTFDPDFRWRYRGWDTPAAIAWYLRFTDEFSRAFGRVMGPERFIELSADGLFASHIDNREIQRLIEFTGIEKTVDEVAEHYQVPYNQKLHKTMVGPEHMALARIAFENAYTAFGGVL